MNPSPVDIISAHGQTLAYVIPHSFRPEKTTFLTPDEFKQQVGFIVYPAGGEVKRHVHKPLERQLVGTSEVLVVQKGACRMDVYSQDKQFVASRDLVAGDIVIMVGGGHGFHMSEDTVFLEVKQGPYTGVDEKERF